MTTQRTNRYFLALMICFLSFFFLFPRLLPIQPPWLLDCVIQLSIYLPMLVLYPFLSGQSPQACYHLRGLRPLDGLLCLGMGLLIQPLMSLIVALTSFLQANVAAQGIQEGATQGLLPLLLTGALLPGIFEELMFRGAILSGYRSRGTRSAIVVSAFLFGILHMNLQQAIYATLLGLLFGLLVTRSQSILASILPHTLINAYNSLMVWLSRLPGQPSQGPEPTLWDTLLVLGVLCAISLPLFLLLLRVFLRRNPPPPEPPLPQRQERLWTPSLVVSVLLFLSLGAIPNLRFFQG